MALNELQIQVGWNRDPWVPGQQRMWDGRKWTDEVKTVDGYETTAPKQLGGKPGTSNPEGWYPDPWHMGEQRRWDGSGWTDEIRAPTGTELRDPHYQTPAAPGWGTDPYGIYDRERFWNGAGWTDRVKTADGVEGTAPQEMSAADQSVVDRLDQDAADNESDFHEETPQEGCATSFGIPAAAAAAIVAAVLALIAVTSGSSNKSGGLAASSCSNSGRGLGGDHVVLISCDEASSEESSSSESSSEESSSSQAGAGLRTTGVWIITEDKSQFSSGAPSPDDPLGCADRRVPAELRITKTPAGLLNVEFPESPDSSPVPHQGALDDSSGQWTVPYPDVGTEMEGRFVDVRGETDILDGRLFSGDCTFVFTGRPKS